MATTTEQATEKTLRDQLQPEKFPRHVAIIMDGNGRWAKQQGKPRIYGHRVGVESVREIVKAASGLGIAALTLFAFSSENWRRPPAEVRGLMALLMLYLKREIREMNTNNIRFNAIGRLTGLPEKIQEQIAFTMQETAQNTGLVLSLALNYGSQNEILDAVTKIVSHVQEGKLTLEALTPEVFEKYLYTADLPELDLVIRTSGEMRISNFLLWQLAYAELYVTPVFWPDFRKRHFYEALLEYQKRERRFGKSS